MQIKTMASPVARMVKSLPAMQETQIRSLGQKDPLEKKMATPSSILVWKSHGWRSLTGYNHGVTKCQANKKTYCIKLEKREKNNEALC